MRTFHWQMTNEQIVKVEKPMEEIKERYAMEMRAFIERLPCKFHMLAFYEACDPAYQVCVELGKMDRNKFGMKEQTNDNQNANPH